MSTLLEEPAPGHVDVMLATGLARSRRRARSGVRPVYLFAACASLAAAVACAAPHDVAPPGPTAPGPRAHLELVAVDDSVDPLSDVPEGALPRGVSMHIENEPVGRGKVATTHFARAILQPGESRAQAVERLKPWLASIAVPTGARYGWEDVVEQDDATRTYTVVGIRTLLLSGPAVLTTADVSTARTTQSSLGNTFDGPQYNVAITLSPDGARRFEAFTGQWVERRLAILVDGQVDSAPVVKAVIGDGRVTVTVGSPADRGRQKEIADTLAHDLTGR